MIDIKAGVMIARHGAAKTSVSYTGRTRLTNRDNIYACICARQASLADWLTQHATGAYQINNFFVLFENDEDAMLFKMTFS